MCPEDRLPPQGWCAPPAPWGGGGPRREGRRALFLRLLGTLPRCVTLTLRTSAPRNPAVGAVLLRVPLCPQPRPGTGAGTGDGRGNRCLGVRELLGQRGVQDPTGAAHQLPLIPLNHSPDVPSGAFQSQVRGSDVTQWRRNTCRCGSWRGDQVP